MSLHRVCCCGLEGECPCHYVNGGQATYTASWTGSVTATTPSCACLLGLYGPAPGDPATYADYVTPTETWSGTPVTVSWDSNDPLNAEFCTLSGSVQLSDIGLHESQLYNGACTDTANSYSLNVYLSISVTAPDPANGINYWEAEVLVTSMIRLIFRSTQSTCLPTVWTLYSSASVPPAGCTDWAGVATWTYTVGTFSLT